MFFFFKKRYFGSLLKIAFKTFNYNIQPSIYITPNPKMVAYLKVNSFNSTLALCQIKNLFFSNYLIIANQTYIFLVCNPLYAFYKYLSSCYNYNVFAKSEGSFSLLVEKLDRCLTIQLPSNKLINLPLKTLGVLAKKRYALNKFESYGKAGYNKFFYLKPKVRGTAKNARDHPHGGRSSVSGSKKSP